MNNLFHQLSNLGFIRNASNLLQISLIHTRLPPPHKENPNWNTTHTFVRQNPLLSLLERCTSLDQLKQIQAQMTLTSLILDGFATSRLIAFCAISGSADLHYCSLILRNIINPNLFCWNVAIRGYSESSDPEESVLLYKQLLRTDARPDNFTYPFMFKACAKMSDLRTGDGVLGHVLNLGLDSDVFVLNAAIHLYAVCGGLDMARQLFDQSIRRDLVSWNSMINGYVQGGHPREALELFWKMKLEKIEPDDVTMIGVVSCCTQLEDLDLGRRFHLDVEENGIKFTIPLCNALMDMYAKCGDLNSARLLFDNMPNKTMVSWTTMIVGYLQFGSLGDAKRIFDDMPERDVVPWNALIAGYIQQNHCKEALTLFHEMQDSHVKPNEVTMVSLLSACAQIGALDIGMWLHQFIDKHNFTLTVALGTALVDMYAKCGNIEKSLCAFNKVPQKNALTWTAIIGGLAMNGHGQDAIRYFLQMTDAGLVPDEVTFVGVLSACCHAGLVDDGRRFFTQMQSKYNILPKVKHYSCMVDLLGRAGFLDEAEELVKSMPMEPDAVVWGALFFACRTQMNISMGERAAWKLCNLDPNDGGIYVLLANMYTDANMRHKASKVRRLMKEKGVEKYPGCSSIEVNGTFYEFMVRDKSHPQCKEIYSCLMQLSRQMEFTVTP